MAEGKSEDLYGGIKGLIFLPAVGMTKAPYPSLWSG